MVPTFCEGEPPRRFSKELIYNESTNKQSEFVMKNFCKKNFCLKWSEMKSKPKKLKKIKKKFPQKVSSQKLRKFQTLVKISCPHKLSSQGCSNQFWTGTAVKERDFRAKTGTVGSLNTELKEIKIPEYNKRVKFSIQSNWIQFHQV